MNIEQLRHFLELERCGSISSAAKHLFISPQGLNKSIAALEAETGTQLVERTRQGTILTEDGRRFLAFARGTTRAYHELIAGFVRFGERDESVSPVQLGATSYALHTVLEEPLGEDAFASARIEELPPSVILESLAKATSQSGMKLYMTDLFENSSLAAKALENNVFEPIMQTEFGVISHIDYPLDAKTLTPEELLDVPFVCFKDESIDWILEKTFGNAQPRSLLLRTSNSEQLIKRVLTKRVVCLLDSFAYHRLKTAQTPVSELLRFTPVAGMPTVTTGFLHRHDLALSEDEIAFKRMLKARFNHRFSDFAR